MAKTGFPKLSEVPELWGNQYKLLKYIRKVCTDRISSGNPIRTKTELTNILNASSLNKGTYTYEQCKGLINKWTDLHKYHSNPPLAKLGGNYVATTVDDRHITEPFEYFLEQYHYGVVGHEVFNPHELYIETKVHSKSAISSSIMFLKRDFPQAGILDVVKGVRGLFIRCFDSSVLKRFIETGEV